MASTPKISIRIGLDGKEDVIGGLGEIKSKGLDTFNALKNTAGSALGDGGRKSTQQLKDIALHSIEAKKGVESFREALHVAHPILEAAGLGVGNLGAFSRVASAGLGALVTTAIGAALVGFAKLADEATLAKKHLGDALNNPELGKKAFADISEKAKTLHADVGVLTDGFQSFNKAANAGSTIHFVAAPGKEEFLPGAQNVKLAADATAKLFAIMHAGVGTTADATKEFQEFNAALDEQTKQATRGVIPRVTITPQMIEGLSAGTKRLLSQAFNVGSGQGDLENYFAKAGVSLEQFAQIINNFKVKAPDTKTFTDAIDGLVGDVKKAVADLAGQGNFGGFMADEVGKIDAAIAPTVKNIEDLVAAWEKLKKFAAPVTDLLAPLLAPKPPAPASIARGELPPQFVGRDIQAAVHGEWAPAPTVSALAPGEKPREFTTKDVRGAVSGSENQQPLVSFSKPPIVRFIEEHGGPEVVKRARGAIGIPEEGYDLNRFFSGPQSGGAPLVPVAPAVGAAPLLPPGAAPSELLQSLFKFPATPAPFEAHPQPSGLTSFLNASATPPTLPPAPPITFPPEPRGLTQFLGGPYAPSAPPLSIPTSAPSASTALSPTLDIAPLKTGANDAGSALEALASRIRGIQLPSQVPSGSAGGPGGTPEEGAALGQALGGIIGLSEGGSLGVMPRLPSYVTKFRMGGLAGLPGFASGGHVLARVSNGEHFFPPKEVAAIGLSTLHAMNSFAGGGRIRGPGTGMSDSILASLPRGGFVLNAHAAGMIGEHTLNHLHAMADGGHVDHFSGLQGSPVAMPSLNGNAGRNDGGGDFHLHWPDGSSTSMPMARDILGELSEKSALYRVASGGRRSSAQS